MKKIVIVFFSLIISMFGFANKEQNRYINFADSTLTKIYKFYRAENGKPFVE